MNLGLPSIVIEFTKKAASAITRSGRGVVLLLLNDSTVQQPVSAFTSLADVAASEWETKNYDYIKYAFKGKPSKVLAVRGKAGNGKVDVAASIPLFNCLAFDWFAFPECTDEDAKTLASYFDTAKKTKYKKWKAVLPNCAEDSPAVVNFVTSGISIVWDSEKGVEEVTTAAYTARIAGILAGIPLTQSSTYYVLDEVVDVAQSPDPDGDIGAGKLIIIFDGEKFKIGRGVTSLQTTTDGCPEDFKKIKLVEAADIVRTDIMATYEDNYLGRVLNSYDNKQMFIGAVNSYLKELEGTVIDPSEEHSVWIDAVEQGRHLIENGIKTAEEVAAMSELEIRSANTGSFFAITGQMKFLDAMEDFKLGIRL